MSSSQHNNTTKKGKGRRKVNMVKMENETNLQVTFSKRRAGLFKKASELSTLCGAETAVLVFSPGNKAHSFGHPNVEAIFKRFLEQNISPISDAEKWLEAHRNTNISQHIVELNQIENQLELEQKRANELDQVRNDGRSQQWYPPAINKLDYQQLDRLKAALLHFNRKLESKVENATRPMTLYPPRTTPNVETMHNSNGRSVLGVQIDDGAGNPNAQLQADSNASRPNVQVCGDAIADRSNAITQHELMFGKSSFTIPYSSTTNGSSVNLEESHE
ncbi:Agamous-like MADS-box protein [Sesamum alatum]|uniref:Agamous-like MADS-box protein n=1 Tax=Sesamum alatum TaxID=300844 RepID=A0AAE1YDL1_9LAMI|nr:Agamous-like MADS-box protein [Sesamum alatum]